MKTIVLTLHDAYGRELSTHVSPPLGPARAKDLVSSIAEAGRNGIHFYFPLPHGMLYVGPDHAPRVTFTEVEQGD